MRSQPYVVRSRTYAWRTINKTGQFCGRKRQILVKVSETSGEEEGASRLSIQNEGEKWLEMKEFLIVC